MYALRGRGRTLGMRGGKTSRVAGTHGGCWPMNCPFCGLLDTRVVDSRDTEGKDAVRRRRECVACGQRFTTYEKIEEIPITVVKRDGTTELFHPDKLLRGLMRACAKRNVPTGRLEEIVA